MEGGGGQSSGGGGPAPFLLKTYDMVDDSSTDEVVSWSSAKNSFVVWNPPEFARLLLPAYFKHNNFSSFIRQLNTYGFRKIDPEKWEFANEEFVKDQKHQLKNIHRRKPIHSHTQPQGSSADMERAALDEEIDRLSREKTALQANLWRFKQQDIGRTKLQLDDVEQRVCEMEQRQLRMMGFLAKAAHNPNFVEHLITMSGSSSMDFSLAINKKRRLPKTDYIQEVAETSSVDNHSSTSKSDFGNIFQRDFDDKLKLELSPAVSDSNFLSQSSNEEEEEEEEEEEDGGSPQKKITSEGEDPKDAQMRVEGLSFTRTETLELSDTCTSFGLMRKDTSLSGQVRGGNNLSYTEEGDGHLSCHLNLTLASSSLQVNDIHYSTKIPQLSQDITTSAGLRSGADDDATKSYSQEAPTDNQGPSAPHGRVNDVFWEQFLTERPGSSDNEEASSSFRVDSYEEREERKKGQQGTSWRRSKDMEQLTL